MKTAPHLPQTILGLVPYRPIPPRDAQHPKEQDMFATIVLAGTVTAQGPVTKTHSDGRITIADGLRHLTGWPVTRLRGFVSAVALTTLSLGGIPAAVQAETQLNISHDPTRELYREFNQAFSAW